MARYARRRSYLISTCTFITGLSLILFAKLKLSRFVAYVPIPVVGGYLGFIGYFCLQAGVALCISKPMSTIESWGELMKEKSLLLACPGVLTAFALLLCARRSSDKLPHLMTAIPLIFYIIIYWIWGSECMFESREIGLIGKIGEQPPSSSELIQYLNPKNVEWSILPHLLPTCLGMIIVVAFSSVLDVTAISIDIGQVRNCLGANATS